MKQQKILIVPKMTKFEWDMHRLKFTEKELTDFYFKERVNAEKIIESHKRQKESLEKIRSLLKNAEVIERDKLTRDLVEKYSFVISFGGDNHFQYITHFLDGTPILGINSDPKRSEGALTYVNTDELEEIVPFILEGNFETEEWTRLEIFLDGKKIEQLATSEVFIGEEKRFNMSRHIIKTNGKEEEQKGSGLLITTGVGSTGWYNSASRYLFPEGNNFSRQSKEARFILTEPYNGKLSKLKMINGKIKDNEEIEIISLSDAGAFLAIDSLALIPLKEGARIKVKIGRPLKVLKVK